MCKIILQWFDVSKDRKCVKQKSKELFATTCYDLMQLILKSPVICSTNYNEIQAGT